jgi:hypothetical protein
VVRRVSSTRDCPSCGREAGFHQPSCCFTPVDRLDAIRTKLGALLAEVNAWSSLELSRWSMQLVHDVSKAVGTARWLAHDIEEQRIDRELQNREAKQS